ncbi:MerR family transcriptional regulator [Lipingzhangella sp. LS1_29]|uniref:MerR family transcriptional regulator n=1 Tax=Lipingzhangella rawalii TaxID=2055835 RepID=A0ABU2H4U2_9ACTN|nr:MerR family transcriptional regulator [Lipingzhangella rawalii]MDS1270327.1 MerR family transcriptional regulator [Lipingzhangella rawalii]
MSGESAAGRYTISVMAELTGIPIRTLRRYEERGLLDPPRSDGGTRRYTDADLARARRIAQLARDGVNLEGIRRILELEDTTASANHIP